ncbi:putative lipid phosphate phosphatase protein, partial [Naja naja]
SLPFAILTLVNSPYKRGFYCEDTSILGEAYLVYTERLYSRSQFNNYLAALYKVIGTFLFGSAVSQSLTDLAKYTIGRLRPNFLAVCDPDWTKVNCSVYVQDLGRKPSIPLPLSESECNHCNYRVPM